MKRFLVLVCLALAAVLLFINGCASIAKGTRQVVTISSNVEGADVFLDGVKIGVTPFVGEIKKNKAAVQVKKDGYRTETVALSKTLDGMFWGNIIIGGTVGSITDFATGAAYAYAPASYQVELQSDSQSSLDFQKQLGVRKFAMVYMEEISRDLAMGNGQYLSALIGLIDANATHVTDIAAIRAAFSDSDGSQQLFGSAVVGLL